MAEHGAPIFNKKASERLRNPDDLDKYLRIAHPSVWAFLGSLVALLLGLLSWGFFGSITSTITTKGAVVGDEPLCFIAPEEISRIHIGDVCNLGGELMKVTEVSPVPYSRSEAQEYVKSDYLVSALLSGDWGYKVSFEKTNATGLAHDVPLTAIITVERVAPISLITSPEG